MNESDWQLFPAGNIIVGFRFTLRFDQGHQVLEQFFSIEYDLMCEIFS